MGYYERKAGGALFRAVAIVLGVSLVSFWPWIVGTQVALSHGARKGSATYNVAGWFPEIVWIGILLLTVVLVMRSAQRSAEEQVRNRGVLSAHRVQMAQTNTPWFDPDVRAIVHGTCSIRHRSVGAAQRCRSHA